MPLRPDCVPIRGDPVVGAQGTGVKATEYSVFSQDIRITPSPGSLLMAMVNSFTGVATVVFCMGTRRTSS